MDAGVEASGAGQQQASGEAPTQTRGITYVSSPVSSE